MTPLSAGKSGGNGKTLLPADANPLLAAIYLKLDELDANIRELQRFREEAKAQQVKSAEQVKGIFEAVKSGNPAKIFAAIAGLKL